MQAVLADLEEAVFDAVDEGLPACFDDVGVDADGGLGAGAGAGFHHERTAAAVTCSGAFTTRTLKSVSLMPLRSG